MKYVLQDKYLSVVVNGKPFSLNASHPTFDAMHKAIEKKQWKRIPKLVTVAQQIANAANGSVKVDKGQVYYKGRVVNTNLTRRIIQVVQEKKPVGALLKFMDNLYQNPSQDCINELYDFLGRYKLPVTDDGCFMAYKIVDQNYRDMHTRSIDNSVGTVVVMPRTDVDGDRRTLCSNGFHFCSLPYLAGFPGTYVMGIKIDPKDVVSIPEMDAGKGRTWRYEVVMELADRDPFVLTGDDATIFKTAVLPVEKDRKVLLAKVLAHPTLKRAIKRRKLKARNLCKSTLGRLTRLYASLPPVEAPKPSLLAENPIRVARLQAGLTASQVAEEMDVNVKTVLDAERFARVGQTKADDFIRAINAVKSRGLL